MNAWKKLFRAIYPTYFCSDYIPRILLLNGFQITHWSRFWRTQLVLKLVRLYLKMLITSIVSVWKGKEDLHNQMIRNVGSAMILNIHCEVMYYSMGIRLLEGIGNCIFSKQWVPTSITKIVECNFIFYIVQAKCEVSLLITTIMILNCWRVAL